MPTDPVRSRLGCGAVLALLLPLVLGLFGIETGPRSDAKYPPAASSPYLLPWKADVERLCVQGNRGVVSHYEGREEFAYDFAMPVGSEVCAARAGRVIKAVDKHTGNGTDKPNNVLVVDHGDGTRGVYVHLMQGGCLVKVGERVAQGQAIAKSGNVGRSMLPHLHFEVTDRRGTTLPVSFREAGVPIMLRSYRSKNKKH